MINMLRITTSVRIRIRLRIRLTIRITTKMVGVRTQELTAAFHFVHGLWLSDNNPPIEFQVLHGNQRANAALYMLGP